MSVPFVDILIFAIIAIFLGLRLHSVLGKRTGFEHSTPPDQDRDQDSDQDRVSAVIQEPQPAASADGDGVEAIVKADANFDAQEFITGASNAYGIILEAFAAGDNATLKPLLGYEMGNSFTEAIMARHKANETLAITLVELSSAEITSARIIDGLAIITVDFHSRQTRLLTAEDGTVLDGDKDRIESFHDRWSFERDISSTDPVWLLVETETIAE